VTGPFSIEGVIALEDGPDTPIGGAPGELEHVPPELNLEDSPRAIEERVYRH